MYESDDVRTVDVKLHTTIIALQQTSEQYNPSPQGSRTNKTNNTHLHVSNDGAYQKTVSLGALRTKEA